MKNIKHLLDRAKFFIAQKNVCVYLLAWGKAKFYFFRQLILFGSNFFKIISLMVMDQKSVSVDIWIYWHTKFMALSGHRVSPS